MCDENFFMCHENFFLCDENFFLCDENFFLSVRVRVSECVMKIFFVSDKNFFYLCCAVGGIVGDDDCVGAPFIYIYVLWPLYIYIYIWSP